MEHKNRESPAEVVADIAEGSHRVLYEQVALSRRASLSLEDQQRVADAWQLLGRRAEDTGDVRSYQQYYAQASQQKDAFSDHRQEQFIPAFTRLMVSGMSFKDTEVVARMQLAKLCVSEYGPLAMRALMQECFERGQSPEAWLKAFASSPGLYVQGALAYHHLVPEEKRGQDISTEIIKKCAAEITEHGPEDLLCLGNTPAVHLVGPLLEVVARSYCQTPGLAVELAKTFYDNDNINYAVVARVGLVVFNSPLLTAHMDERAIVAEDVYREACEALSTAECQLREAFWYASRQFSMPAAKFIEYVNRSHPQPDHAFSSAMQRYLKHDMTNEAAACLRNIQAPFLWATAALDYTGFSTNGVALSEDDKWMAQTFADGKSQVRPFVEHLVELNHAAAAAELMKLLSYPTQDPQFAPFFMKAVAKLVLRDRPVGERFCLDVLHQAMNNRQYSLVHALADIGMQQGLVSVARRYAQDFLHNYHHSYHEGRMHAAIITARHTRRLKKTLKT